MLTIIFSWVSILFSIFFLPLKYLWALTSAQGFILAFLSLVWFTLQDFSYSSPFFFIDRISGPLAILTCWLFPLTILAAQSKMTLEPTSRQRTYLANMTILQLITLLAFTTSNLALFFLFFEASLIPTMIIITRWGAQQRRLEAALYFAFYTLLGAVPFLTWLLFFYNKFGSLSFELIQSVAPYFTPLCYPGLFWAIYNSAFLCKLPMYTLHLWLPKAHVEAPIAGSMILAGTLLKLGGYGILRLAPLFLQPLMEEALWIMTVATMGVLATALLCLRQTDLKSLIAMSSVSHMNLIIVAALLSSSSSFSGAMVMMISHGLTSSALFCLANTTYERTNSRTMIILRGAMMIFPLAAAWWLMVALFNLALPPSANFISEILILIALFNWSPMTFLVIALNLIFTTAYTLYIFWSVQRGPISTHLKTLFPFYIREHLLLILHIIPGALLIMNPQLIFL
uniref:NADH-ubiquinone oxidoreductase chain 4 n=1 Tax=Petropedetes sp. MVZ 234827 TaxID=1338816 RepID=S4V2A2_9NEOB|nr:NADH dehydrogenase subunit 4 [Petropedetes sp. MVZ 234827]